MLINFLNQFAESASTDNNQAKLINWYLETSDKNSKYPIIARPTPGTTLWSNSSGSCVRQLFRHNDVAYSVTDNTFYSYNSSGTRTLLGTLSTSSGRIEIASIDNQIMIVDGTYGYIYTLSTNTFAQITDVNFPANPTSVVSMDDFFIIACLNSNLIYASNFGDGTTWNALSFAAATGSGDYIKKLVSHRRELWVMCAQNMELWVDAGTTPFPFQPNQSIYLHNGIVAQYASAICNNNIYILGSEAGSGYGIYQLISYYGYLPQKVSTAEVDTFISKLTSVTDAFAYAYTDSGHEFFVLTFPTNGVTLVYDTVTQQWHQRQSLVNAAQTRHISNCYIFCYGKHLVGDYQSGKVYYLDTTNFTDNNAAISRELQTPPAYNSGNKVYLDKLQIDTDTAVGSNLTFTVTLSKDSGHTFNSLTDGTVPSAGGRMYWTRLGMTQNAFVVNIKTSMNANCPILGAVANIRQGIN